MAAIWTFAIPLMDAPDEPTHAIKAAAIARGQFTTDVRDTRTPLGIRPYTAVRVPRAYAALVAVAGCFSLRHGPATPCAASRPIGSKGPLVSTWTYVGAYPPLYYLITGWPSLVLPPEAALYAMRLVGALVCAALFASGLSSAVACGRRRLLVGAAALALTPTTLFLTASINPNGLEIASAFCVWLAALDLLGRVSAPPTRLLVRLGVSSILLAASRPLSPAFLVGILVATTIAVADRATLARLVRDTRVSMTLVIIGLVTLASAAYVLFNRSASAIIEFPLTGSPSHLTVLRHSLGLTGDRIRQMVGALGWLGPRSPLVPSWLIYAWCVGVTVLVAGALVAGRWRHRSALAGVVVVTLVLPVASETIGAATYGYAWQGRYALPIAVGIPILAGWTIDRAGSLGLRAERWCTLVLASGVAVGLFAAMAAMLAHLLHGPDASWVRALSSGPWPGPVAPPALLIASACGCTALGWRLVVLARRPAESDDAVVLEHRPDA